MRLGAVHIDISDDDYDLLMGARDPTYLTIEKEEGREMTFCVRTGGVLSNDEVRLTCRDVCYLDQFIKNPPKGTAMGVEENYYYAAEDDPEKKITLNVMCSFVFSRYYCIMRDQWEKGKGRERRYIELSKGELERLMTHAIDAMKKGKM
jgi:hypothetical protein